MIVYKGFVLFNRDFQNRIDKFYSELSELNETVIENIFVPNKNDLENIVAYLNSSTYDKVIEELDLLLNNYENKELILNFNNDNYRLDSNNYNNCMKVYRIFCYFCSTHSELFDTKFENIMSKDNLLVEIIKYSWLIKNFVNFKNRLYPNLALNLIKNIELTNKFELLLTFCELCPEMVTKDYKPKIKREIANSLIIAENPSFRAVYEQFKNILLSY
jgi:hypothetical protein